MTGIVKNYIIKRGFGKIRGEDKHDYFVYWKEIRNDNGAGRLLIKNMKVSFDPSPGLKEGQNPIARNVSVIGYDTDKISKEVYFESEMV